MTQKSLDVPKSFVHKLHPCQKCSFSGCSADSVQCFHILGGMGGGGKPNLRDKKSMDIWTCLNDILPPRESSSRKGRKTLLSQRLTARSAEQACSSGKQTQENPYMLHLGERLSLNIQENSDLEHSCSVTQCTNLTRVRSCPNSVSKSGNPSWTHTEKTKKAKQIL